MFAFEHRLLLLKHDQTLKTKKQPMISSKQD